MHMFKEVDDLKFQKVFRTIAKNPGASFYGIADKSKINRTTVVRKVKEQYKLTEKGILRIDPGKRNAGNCWLTYKGLIYAVQIKAIKPEEAHNVRIKHKIEIPCIPEPFASATPAFISLTKEMEKDFPERYYRHVELGPNPYFKEELIGLLPLFSCMFSFADLLKTAPQRAKKYIKGKNVVLPDGTILHDYTKVFDIFTMMIPDEMWKELQLERKETRTS